MWTGLEIEMWESLGLGMLYEVSKENTVERVGKWSKTTKRNKYSEGARGLR